MKTYRQKGIDALCGSTRSKDFYSADRAFASSKLSVIAFYSGGMFAFVALSIVASDFTDGVGRTDRQALEANIPKSQDIRATAKGLNGAEASAPTVSSTFLEQQGPLKHFLSRFITRPQDIDDITHETFVRAFRAEKSGRIEHHKAYIYRIARNLALEFLSKRTSRLTSFIEDACDPQLLQSDEDVENWVSVLEKMDRLKVAISELPPQCQRVFIMHKVYGFKYKEISSQLGISVSTVEKHIMSGLKKCRNSVRQQERPGSVISLSDASARRKRG